MKRFFSCKVVRTDELVVVVETNEPGDIANRVEIPDEVGDVFFGREAFDTMVFDDLDEITEQEALDWTFSGRLVDIPVATLADVEEDDAEE